MMKQPTLLLFLSLFLLSATIALSNNSKLQQCKYQCQQHQQAYQKREQCKSQCKYQYGGEHDERGQSERETKNPYFFDEESFMTRVKTQEGSVRVLERFSKWSDLLRGIENYRVSILEANPNTFTLPNHWDAEAIIFLISGSGTINLLKNDKKESYNLRKGDILRVPAGTTVYLINRDNKEKLYLANLLKPVFTPGHYEAFFGVGGEDPESFYRSFSKDVLEAAFKTPWEKLERLLGQQKQGAIIKASPQQIKEMTRHASSSKGGQWPLGTEWSGPYNLFEKQASHSNQHGQLHEADENDYHQLRDLDVSISFANIRSGSMVAPYYNSKATKVSLVVDGRGYYEMACPHLSTSKGQRGETQSQRISYQRVSAPLSPGSVFVVPAGHPVVTVAAHDQDLLIVCFEINSHGNQKYFLAGQNTIWNAMDKEEKELSFNIPAREVEQIFKAQDESFFLEGPQQRQEGEREGRAYA